MIYQEYQVKEMIIIPTHLVLDKKGKPRAYKFKFSDLKPRERILIIGRTGTGKSVLTSKVLDYFSRKTLVILIDTKNEYHYIPSYTDDCLKLRKGLFRCNELIYKGITIDKPYDISEYFSAILFERAEKQHLGAILAIEELGAVISKYGKLYDQCYNTAKLIQQGRSFDLGFLGTSQRPQELHTTLLSQCTQFISFDLTSSQDIKAVEYYFEPEWYNLLNKHQFLYLNFQTGKTKRCYKIYLTEDEKKFYTRQFGKAF